MPAAGQPWSVAFRRDRERGWRELETLVDRVERRGLRALPAEQLVRLPVLYRAAASALSVARASVLDRNLLDYLETLVARAYVAVYAPRKRVATAALEHLLVGFPRLVRGIGPHLLLSALVLLLGAGTAWMLTVRDLDLFYLFVDAGMAQGRDPTASTEDLRRTLFAGGEHGSDQLLLFASQLFAHNSMVGILSFGLGFLAGAPVVLLLFLNGMLLGALAALFAVRGLGVEFWSWVLPHGITELLAIALCGAAGLAVADRLLFPGRFPRRHELAQRGRAMGGVVAGAVAMLLLAAMVEGVFRQLVGSLPLRFALAALTGLGWLAYFGLAGREQRT